MDKLQAMAVFVQIADSGSLTAAARELDKSLPAIVRTLAALEQELEVRLLNRTTRRIALTEQGRLYLAHCRKILADIDETEQMLGNDQLDPSGLLTLTAPVRFGEMYVSPAVSRYLKQHPRVQVNLLLLDRMVNMLDEGIDLAVRIAPLSDSSLIARPVSQIRQVVCASPELLATHGTPLHPETLAQLPCVRFTGVSSGSVWHFQEGTKRLSVKINGSLMCNHIASSVDACVAGLGFGHFYSMPDVKQGRLEIVLEKFELPSQPVSLVYQYRQLMSAKLRTLVDWLTTDLNDSLVQVA